MTTKEELLTSILNCGTRDLDKLEELINNYENLDGEFDEIMDYVKDLGEISFGTIAYAAMSLTMEKITENMRKAVKEFVNKNEQQKYLKAIEKFENDFNPYIDYLDTFYNNFLDEIDILMLPEYPSMEYVTLLKRIIKGRDEI